MDEDTTPAPDEVTPGGPPADGAGDHSQDTPPAAAATDDTKPAEGGDKPADDGTSAPKFDNDLDDWADKRGYGTLETDKERRLAQDARNSQRDFSKRAEGRKAEEARAKLDQTITDTKPKPADKAADAITDPLEDEVASLNERVANAEARGARAEYFAANGVTSDEAEAMAEIFKERVDKGGKKAFDFWSDPANIKDWHDLAKQRVAANAAAGGVDKTTTEVEAARKEERERLAKLQAAQGPQRDATKTTTTSKSEDEARLERFSKWD